MEASRRLDGKVVVLAGPGGPIGTAVARAFAAEGARVMLVARRAEPLEELAGELGAGGAEARWATADITTSQGAEDAIRAAEAAFGGVDIVYNNLGDAASIGKRLDETPEADWDYLVSINLRPAYTLTHSGVPALRRRGGGVLIHTSASPDIRARAHSGYGAAKAALIQLTNSTARSYRADNIRVVCICPHTMADESTVTAYGKLDRPGTGRDIGRAAVFLASDEASWISGIELPVNGALA
jgi:NAD(P)-dependent dehydrogenase (short-subunit alcohol dehydrogenase family)